jgi:hypothetical protein
MVPFRVRKHARKRSVRVAEGRTVSQSRSPPPAFAAAAAAALVYFAGQAQAPNVVCN